MKPDPVFGTGAASLYLPAFLRVASDEWRVVGNLPARFLSLTTRPSPLKMAARVGLAPTPNGLTGRRATFTPPGSD